MIRQLPFGALAALVLLAACNSESGPGAPVQAGSFMVYNIVETVGPSSIDYEVRVDVAQNGGVYDLKVTSTRSGSAPEQIKVDKSLIPSDNVIKAFDLGRLWLPPEGRAPSKRTACGVVGEKRKYRNWEVWPVDGICGLKNGSRFYEVNTGMLVGFMFPGGNEMTAYLKSSG